MSQPRKIELYWGLGQPTWISTSRVDLNLAQRLPETWYLEATSDTKDRLHAAVTFSLAGKHLIIRAWTQSLSAPERKTLPERRIWKTTQWRLEQKDEVRLSAPGATLSLGSDHYTAEINQKGLSLFIRLKHAGVNAMGTAVRSLYIEPDWQSPAFVRQEIPSVSWEAEFEIGGAGAHIRSVGWGFSDHVVGFALPGQSPVAGWFWGRVRTARMLFAFTQLVGQRGNPSVGWVVGGDRLGQALHGSLLDFTIMELGYEERTGVVFPRKFTFSARLPEQLRAALEYRRTTDSLSWPELNAFRPKWARVLYGLRPTGGHARFTAEGLLTYGGVTEEAECLYEVVLAP